jgi:NAD+ diphosphatase
LLDRSHTTGFALNTLDRMANRREDESFVATLYESATARCIILSGEIPALKLDGEGTHDALFTMDEARALGTATHKVFLGCHGERALFARLIEAASHDNAQERGDLSFIDLRTIATQGLVPPDIVGALSQAKSLLYWHKHNMFCANCGEPTRASVGGSRRECDNCKRHHFPRLEPVVIMLVTDGERCLLGRQTRFPTGMYSCLAGFAEIGETIEDAVRRETLEEAGIRVGRVTYLASQPWPFPSSMMIGCLAEARSTEIVLDRVELEDARWFSKEETRQLLTRTHPLGFICPPKLAIANLLMRSWAEEGAVP